MSDVDIIEKIKDFEKEIKIHWERLLQKYKSNELTKEIVREFKSEILIPNYDKVTDLALVIIERKRDDLYPVIINFFKTSISYSSYYQRQKLKISFNLSSETEHLGVLLPAYESTVRLFIIGAVASIEENYSFISQLSSESIIWQDDENGKKIYRSILFYPWFNNDLGAGNLTTYFEEAKKKLSEDKLILERYFSLINDNYMDHLCQFDFLVGLKIDLLGQNEVSYFRYYPNYARYYFQRTQEIVQKIINQDKSVVTHFPISESDFKIYMKDLVQYCEQHNRDWQYSWLDSFPKWFEKYVK